MKIYYDFTGCSLERVNSKKIARILNAVTTDDIFEADVIILYFCVISIKEIEYIKPILDATNKMKGVNPDLKVFAGGCAKEVLNLNKYGNLDGTFRRGHMIEDLAPFLNYDPEKAIFPMPDRGGITIGLGCDYRKCGFCKKQYLPMPLTSKSPDYILSEVKAAVSEGFGDIVLQAENSTEYGLDLTPSVNLLQLLKSICALEGVNFLTIHGLCLDELVRDEELLEYIKNNSKIRKVQLEAQSLTPVIRKNMRLSSSVDDVIHVFRELKRKYIISNIMVGYPGENSHNFEEMLDLIKKKDLHFIQPNQYVNTPLTYGSTLTQVPKIESDLRSIILLNCIKKLRENFAKKLLGTTVTCVYTTEEIFEMLEHTATVELNNKKIYSYGQTIVVKITGIVSLLDSLDFTLRFEGEEL